MQNTHTISACKENLCAVKSRINFYDFQLTSALREYRKQEVLSDLLDKKHKSKNNVYANKLNYLQDEFSMQIEESLDFRPKKRQEINFISLA